MYISDTDREKSNTRENLEEENITANSHMSSSTCHGGWFIDICYVNVYIISPLDTLSSHGSELKTV